ncbi:sulfotransferase (plasmid) [Rhizobium sp. TH2]|uniref:sulfotransferase n=1 Tax=Rhizobium sp. TH2 TaxID=2775403 RepID=UPI002157EDC2|nr:sulfotransferase [Rhizobium sp. TH2]UVC12410.1 sulfotransferase [Rhizobium sp. TH2]
MAEDWERKYEWKRTWPDDRGLDGKPLEDYSCFDGQYAGRIRFEPAGPTKGLWQWSGAYPKPMRGAPVMPNGGYADSAAEAARAVEEYWDVMRDLHMQFDDEMTEKEKQSLSKPDFLCIGAQKAATSWLNKVLLEHPQVFMPPVNELHFFDSVGRDAPQRARQIKLAHKAIKRERRKAKSNKAYIGYLKHLISFPVVTADWYRAAYSWPMAEGVKKGDITPSYLELGEGQVAYARQFLGPTKLILIVRRPADRLLSQMRMWAGRADIDAPNEEQWLNILKRIQESESRGGYSTGIPLWSSHFGIDSLLIMPFSDIRKDPHGTIARVQDHIGVPRFEDFTLLTEKIHPTKKYEISDKVKSTAEDLTFNEAEYLRSEFGDEFFEKTR